MRSLCIATTTELPQQLQQELDGIENLFTKLQQKDGGFVGRLGESTSDMYYTFFALEIFKTLEKEKLLDYSNLKDFVFSCYDKKGGFGYRKGACPDLVHTFCGIGASIAMGSFDEIDAEKTSEFILSLCSTEGGFRKDENSVRATAYSTFYGIFSLYLLDKSYTLNKEFIDKTSGFLTSLQTPEGGFKASPKTLQPNLVETASALFALYLMDRINLVEEEQIINFILKCRLDGNFKNHLRSKIPDLNSVFCAVNSLALLGALNKVSSEEIISGILNFRTPWGGFTNISSPDIEYTYYAIYSMILLSRER